MKAIKIYKILIVLLVLINLVLLYFMLRHQDHRPMDPAKVNLANDIGLTGKNAEEVNILQENHHKEMRRLMELNKNLHIKLFDQFVMNNTDSVKANMVIDSIVRTHRSVEYLLFNYFKDISKFCNQNQRQKLNVRFHELMVNGPGNRPKK